MFDGRPTLPAELTCFICNAPLTDPVIILCEKRNQNTCSANDICRGCVEMWNTTRLRNQVQIQSIKSESLRIEEEKIVKTGIVEKNEKTDSNSEDSSLTPAAEPTSVPSNCANASPPADNTTESENGSLDTKTADDVTMRCPVCGSQVIKLIPDVAIMALISVLPLSNYRVEHHDLEVFDDKTGKMVTINKDGLFKNASEVEEESKTPSDVPYYLSMPDKMRANEYRLTSDDLNIVKSLGEDGLSVVMMPSIQSMQLTHKHNIIPVEAAKSLAIDLAQESIRRKTRPPLHSTAVPFLLPSVGGKLKPLVERVASKPDDSFGPRGHHLLVIVASPSAPSVTIAGICRITGVSMGLYSPTQNDVEGLEVDQELVRDFVNSSVTTTKSESLGYNGYLASYITDSIRKEGETAAQEMLKVPQMVFFFKLSWLISFPQPILIPLKSQPLYNVILPYMKNTRNNYWGTFADIGGTMIIPALIAKLRASEASTAISNREGISNNTKYENAHNKKRSPKEPVKPYKIIKGDSPTSDPNPYLSCSSSVPVLNKTEFDVLASLQQGLKDVFQEEAGWGG